MQGFFEIKFTMFGPWYIIQDPPDSTFPHLLCIKFFQAPDNKGQRSQAEEFE